MRLSTNEVEPYFETLGRGAQSSVIKLEVRPEYLPDEDVEPMLAAWNKRDLPLARHRYQARRAYNNYAEWRRVCPGVRLRLRIVDRPINDYLRSQIEISYATLEEEDVEKVLLVEREDVPKDLWIPEGDSWIFDDTHALAISYDDDSMEVTGRDVYGPGEVRPYLVARDVLRGLAQPIAYDAQGFWIDPRQSS